MPFYYCGQEIDEGLYDELCDISVQQLQEEKNAMAEEVTCHFCDNKITDAELAALAGWAPTYWDVAQDKEITNSVCPDCLSGDTMEWSEEGGMWIYELPPRTETNS